MNEKEEMKTDPELEPEWLMGNQINELAFCKAFLEEHPMICINNTFFTTDGRVTGENMKLIHLSDLHVAQSVHEHVFGKSITDPCLGWEKTE